MTAPAGTLRPVMREPARRGLPQGEFDDLYSAVYRILDDAKASHDLVKLYKGSHASPLPHYRVLDFGSYFYRTRRGLLAYACEAAGGFSEAHLDTYDREHAPRVSVRAVYEHLASSSREPGESRAAFLRYLTSRTHDLGAYRGGTSGYDDEARAVAAAHFSTMSVPATPANTEVFCGGAKGVFLAFCAALMTHRHHDQLTHEGGLLLAPEGYYQSLRLMPAIFGGEIHVVPQLSGETIAWWLAQTARRPHRAVYVPLVNNADGRVLTRPRALSIAHAILGHNRAHPDAPVYVLADDVYAGSYLTPGLAPTSIASLTGTALGNPALGAMSDWTVTVATPSKTFALPTCRIAFATTTSQRLLEALCHYRTVFSMSRAPQVTELTAAAALCLTPATWAEEWNRHYRAACHALIPRIEAINTEAGFAACTAREPEGGWYLPLRLSPSLFGGRAASAVDAFAVMLHYGRDRQDTGIGFLPGELFGQRTHRDGFAVRGSLAVTPSELDTFTQRLHDAVRLLRGPDGPAIVSYARRRARAVCDLDTILARCRY
jgi:aspartate/methionine/tyrosine aminotransferase